MSLEIILVFLILISALVLFFTNWVRMDIVALMVLSVLTLTGLITPTQALSGFSNPAVITVWAMFVLSAALYQTGIARIIGRQVLNMAGTSEWRMIFVIMLTSGLLSAVMNNIGVAVLMLPVVMDICRTTQRAPSRLLMPLAYGCLLGGLTTLIGTPPNLLVSFALEDAGLKPFELLDFTPVGMGVMLGGIIFISFIGRHLLPHSNVLSSEERKNSKTLPSSYDLQERTFMMRIGEKSELSGKTLTESRLRAALGINVLSIRRAGGGTILEPGPDTIIRTYDYLFVQGRLDAIRALREWKIVLPTQKGLKPEQMDLSNLDFYEIQIAENSSLASHAPLGSTVRKQLHAKIIALKREKVYLGNALKSMKIQAGDLMLLQGEPRESEQLVSQGIAEKINKVTTESLITQYRLHESLLLLEVAKDPELFDKAVSETPVGEAFGLNLLGVIKDGNRVIPQSDFNQIQTGDHFLVQGNVKDLTLLQGLMDIEIPDEKSPSLQSLETPDVQMAEVVLEPRSLLAGKTLREINFRKKYGVTVLAIWREGRAYRTNLHNLPLRVGEALLLYGKRDKLEMIGQESDFILLTDTMSQPLRTHKALTATLVMAGILLPVLLGLFPLATMAVVGIIMMVLTGCLKMEEAYRAIEWRSVFLIAGMLPLGVAMDQTGAASLLANGVVEIFGRFGPWGVLSGLYVMTLLATLAIPPAALVVIMSPIALNAAETFQISPYSLMMAIAIAAAGSFLSPISHPANLLVMGPGGYKFTDYIKLGLPLSLVVMAVVLLLLPIFWPL